MKTLSISEQDARKIYTSAIPELKTILEGTFGKTFFSQKITDRIKTFIDACSETGEDPYDSKFNNGTKDEIAYKKLKVIVQALNEGWTPDWNDEQRKWRPWFYMGSPGFRFRAALFGNPGSGVSAPAFAIVPGNWRSMQETIS